MDFWNNKVGVSKAAAEMQISIIKTFSPEKRMKIALDFANLGVEQTREWIKKSNPNLSELEVTLEFVKLMYYKTGRMTEDSWNFYEKQMRELIKKDWSNRFREMMKDNNWNYEDVAKLGNFKSGKVVEATVSRGLPSFAKLAVVVYEKIRTQN